MKWGEVFTADRSYKSLDFEDIFKEDLAKCMPAELTLRAGSSVHFKFSTDPWSNIRNTLKWRFVVTVHSTEILKFICCPATYKFESFEWNWIYTSSQTDDTNVLVLMAKKPFFPWCRQDLYWKGRHIEILTCHVKIHTSPLFEVYLFFCRSRGWKIKWNLKNFI